MEKDKKEKKDRYIKRLLDSYKEGNKRTFTVYKILNVLVVLTAIRCIFTKNFESLATCLLRYSGKSIITM